MKVLMYLKRLFCFIVFCFLALIILTNVSFAQSIALQWDIHPDTKVVGYKLYRVVNNTQTLVQTISDRSTYMAIYDTPDVGDVCFVLTAYIVSGVQSDPTPIVCTLADKPGVVDGFGVYSVTETQTQTQGTHQ